MDYGETWTVIEWTLNLSCVGPMFNNSLFFGWENGTNNQIGVGVTVPGGDYMLLNDGLPNLNILCMEMFDMVNTPSFWVGTEQGAFFCTGFLTPNEDETISPAPVSLRNYPNPFSKSTTISFNAPVDRKDSKVEIYNIRGELVFTENMSPSNSVIWNGINHAGAYVTNGMYLCRFVSKGRTLASKAIVLIR